MGLTLCYYTSFSTIFDGKLMNIHDADHAPVMCTLIYYHKAIIASDTIS